MAPSIPTEQWAQVVEQTGKRELLPEFQFLLNSSLFLRINIWHLSNFSLAVVYKKIPVQKPGPDEVLVNIKFSGVCHTDLHAVNGDWPLATKLPLVGGHEGAGVVVAKGDLVNDIEIGDHAGVKVCSRKSLNIEPSNIISSGSTDPA